MAAAQENIKLPWYVVDGHGNAGPLKNMCNTRKQMKCFSSKVQGNFHKKNKRHESD